MALTYRLGGWVKADMDAICKAVSKIRTAEVILHPALIALKQLIEEDPEINMYFTTMFQQKFVPPQKNPITDYMDMLRKMQTVITSAPVFNSDLGSAPLNHLLIYVMATPSGTIAFINDKVNKCFKDILNSWKKVLDSQRSQQVLNREVNDTYDYRAFAVSYCNCREYRYYTGLALWKRHINLLLQGFRSVSSDLHQFRAYGSKAPQ